MSELISYIEKSETLSIENSRNYLVFPGDPAYGDEEPYVILSDEEISGFPSRRSVYDTIYKETDYSIRRKKILETIGKIGFHPSDNNLDSPDYEHNFLRDIDIDGVHHLINLRLQSNLNCRIDYLTEGPKQMVYFGFFDPHRIMSSFVKINSSDFFVQIRDFLLAEILD